MSVEVSFQSWEELKHVGDCERESHIDHRNALEMYPYNKLLTHNKKFISWDKWKMRMICIH